MKTETLAIAKPPKRRGSAKSSRKLKPGLILRLVMAAAIIAAASWYLVPALTEWSESEDVLTSTMLTTDNVNLREGPATSFDVISVVPIGTEVAASTQPEAGFLQVNVDGTRGWMSAAYLSSPDRVVAQSQTVLVPEPEPGTVRGETFSDPNPTTIVAQAPAPEPTTAPTYAPVVAGSAMLAAEPQPGEKWIEVDRSTGTVTLHNGEIVVAEFDALIGKDLSADGYYSTAIGTYYVHVKEKALVETPFAEGVFLTDFVGFDPDRSNGFHSPVRDEFGNVVHTGGTTTLGCVRLSEEDAIFLFNFSHIGMRVEVHD